ncbi:MAG: tetraacyldisaccharide 4'-kinase [gamma proteobacterium symbiont of Taylorina sp.]|nr:tetraacyldisaccharide 4'-kinase [gamma proteobacterium symbiont of Taylorina sp.]
MNSFFSHNWQTINIISLILSPLSLIFCVLVSIRRLFYRTGLLNSYTSSLPVIVVGNIYIGGSGKTPFVIWLVKQLKMAGFKPGIVSRGYGALNDKKSNCPFPRLVNQQQNPQLFADEPLLIHQQTHCPVIIDPVRNHALQKIEQDTDCDIIISDDGLQHYAMSRDIEINITDARRLYGNGLCLPAGPLREGRRRLKSIDYLVYNTSQQKKLNVDSAYVDNEYSMSYIVNPLQPLSGDENVQMTMADLKGKKVHAVAGIGDPGNFFMLLKNYGLIIIEHPFDDHYQYKKEDLIFADSYPVIMTEKDAVKCRFFNLSNSWFLPIEAKVDNALIESIIKRLTPTPY